MHKNRMRISSEDWLELSLFSFVRIRGNVTINNRDLGHTLEDAEGYRKQITMNLFFYVMYTDALFENSYSFHSIFEDWLMALANFLELSLFAFFAGQVFDNQYHDK
ncbi:hypothetical protein ACJX0J_005705, partial [Zea mays]